ncbi:MAG: hypothetical protein ACTHKB_12990 [Burkholderiaceae bacterium]
MTTRNIVARHRAARDPRAARGTKNRGSLPRSIDAQKHFDERFCRCASFSCRIGKKLIGHA